MSGVFYDVEWKLVLTTDIIWGIEQKTFTKTLFVFQARELEVAYDKL